MVKYFDINKNGQIIRCKLYFCEDAIIKKVVLHGHGFAGHKDNGTAEKFANRVLAKHKDIAVLTYNLPCHGDDVKKLMSLQDCMTYMDIVLDYIKTELHVTKIYSNATSFGGYLVLKYIKEHGNPFVKIALRCPAVNNYDVLTKTVMQPDDFSAVMRGETVQVGFDRKIDLNYKFVEELKECDICKFDYQEFAKDMLIIHGTKDEIVPFEVGKKFAEANHIDFVAVPGSDHRFQDPACMEIALNSILEFFGF